MNKSKDAKRVKEGIDELNRKRTCKEAGSITFHIDGNGVVTKIKVDKIIK